MASSVLDQLVSILAPPLCAACGSIRAEGSVLCRECEAGMASTVPVIEAGPPGVDVAVAAAPFEGAARQVALGLKYARRLSLARMAAAAMLRALPAGERPDAVVPVPPGPWRWRWRGFDPAEEIALEVAKQAAIPLSTCLVRDGGRRQVGRRRSERLANPPQVRVAGDAPREALLVDDVWTTGATLSACARALREAGSRRVVALTFAHAINGLARRETRA
ncbi:MAG: ComF family protein [Solirubrobacterales bacterium]